MTPPPVSSPASPPVPPPVSNRELHHRWLLELTQLPTAAGREYRVIDWVRRWVAERPALALTEDAAGNLTIAFGDGVRGRIPPSGAPVYFTAHMDHPAFVVDRIVAPGVFQLGFRGGVMDDYFDQARVVVYSRDKARVGGVLTGKTESERPYFQAYLAETDAGAGEQVAVGDIATWELPPAEIRDGLVHTSACDDLAALASALAAYDVLLTQAQCGAAVLDTRLLLTRAEEIGFIGAIAACREKTMPPGSRVLALENSRSFEESPIGGGPIVRVGDRMSIFSPSLTAAVARRAEEIGGPAAPMASQKAAERTWKWQRKLMAGGACEATVFCGFGYEATCLCLPLGNYHNMADLTAVQAGTHTQKPRVGREYISVADFDGLVDLLIACGQRLPEAGSARGLIEKLWNERAFVLSE